ncbi:hypothetical protein MO973_06525 [Paenibacillus sp. TRM 82003]|uniref:hypothetical protein n=1 Tax=Kineococcus sp. TRM81007 TaxID=2925831 RepID=UPI001F5693A7|nr:hypothetical protein [Kineococcus sp. TRM81007]MCI2237530.1 hypothetical protein [Kineococcus sp. TRM81007]MCI3919884.1 hypothetical protein [Paenibacillus sp. TRM 82003]
MSGGRWSRAHQERYLAARAGGEPSASAGPVPAPPAAERTAVRHCWVLTPRDGARHGLLLAWRRDPEGWLGRVAYVLLDTAGRPVLVEGWVPASVLRPAPGPT